jgi:hypothetical protein
MASPIAYHRATDGDDDDNNNADRRRPTQRLKSWSAMILCRFHCHAEAID